MYIIEVVIISTNNFLELKNKSDDIISRGWLECPTNNTGNVGLLFERLLGLSNHNFSIPDYDGIEIKTKIIHGMSKITLFNATPDSYLYIIKRIHDVYGYPDRTHRQFKVFNLSFSAVKRTYINKTTYAKLHINRKNKQLALRIYNQNNILIDEEISWSFDMLQEKLNTKLQYMFLMYAERKKFKGKGYCKYLKYYFFRCKGFEAFLNSLEKGNISVTFTIGVFKSGKRLGQIHDHGTSFDIDINFIQEVFDTINI